MRGSKAKRIRKYVYGEMSQRAPRQYVVVGGTIFNKPESLRMIYQALKRS